MSKYEYRVNHEDFGDGGEYRVYELLAFKEMGAIPFFEKYYDCITKYENGHYVQRVSEDVRFMERNKKNLTPDQFEKVIRKLEDPELWGNSIELLEGLQKEDLSLSQGQIEYLAKLDTIEDQYKILCRAMLGVSEPERFYDIKRSRNEEVVSNSRLESIALRLNAEESGSSISELFSIKENGGKLNNYQITTLVGTDKIDVKTKLVIMTVLGVEDPVSKLYPNDRSNKVKINSELSNSQKKGMSM